MSWSLIRHVSIRPITPSLSQGTYFRMKRGKRGLSSTSNPPKPLSIGFVGLGAMGYQLAAHLTRWAKKQDGQCFVYDTATVRSEQHAEEHGSRAVRHFRELEGTKLVFFCLPTSQIVRSVLLNQHLASHLSKGAIVVDCTSGDPKQTRELASVLNDAGIEVVDAPVSGGPRGAEAGTVAVMVGGKDEAVAVARPALETFGSIVQHVGGVGTGHAVKAVNNALNATHLAMAAEGLLALVKAGVEPAKALQVINGSSGRSLQTEVRIPKEVLTRRFGYGFQLGLMRKDVNIARTIMKENFPEGRYFERTFDILDDAVGRYGYDSDYTTLVKVLEETAKVQLREK